MTQHWTRKIYGDKGLDSVNHFIKKIFCNNYWFDDKNHIIYLYHTINDINTKVVKLIVPKNFDDRKNDSEFQYYKKIVQQLVTQKQGYNV